MRKLLFLLIIGLSIIAATPAQADYSRKVEIVEAFGKRSIVIKFPHAAQNQDVISSSDIRKAGEDERWMIHVSRGCSDLRNYEEVSLAVSGQLNANEDIIANSSRHKCDIELAEPVTERLFVKHVKNVAKEAILVDEDNNKFTINYQDECQPILGYKQDYVYALQSGDKLQEADRLVLPQKEGVCQTLFVKDEGKEGEEEDPVIETDEEGDTVLPTTPKRARAIPGNSSVLVYWRDSTDNKGISHYIISYSTSSIDPDLRDFEDMPNQVRSNSNRKIIRGLEKDRTYYFYIAAVDKFGNVSSRWSNEARARTKSSIPEDRTTNLAPRAR